MNRKLKSILRERQAALQHSDKTLSSIFEIMFRNRDAVLCESNDGIRIHRHTYGEIADAITDISSGLYQRIGATHEFVALDMENSADWIVAFWAILKSGNKPYLVNRRYPLPLTNAILHTLNIRYTLCIDTSSLDTETIALSSLRDSGALVPTEVFEDELAFSSSATSMNEVVCFYSGAQIAEQILNFKSIIRENPRMAKHYKGQLKQLAFLPFYHVFGLFAVYFWFTFFARTLVFLRNYSPDTILSTCRRHQVTHIFAVPMLWHTVEQQVWDTVKKEGKETTLRRGIRWMTRLQNLFPAFGPDVAKWVMRSVCDRLFGRSVMFCINGGSYLRDSAMELLNGIGYSTHNGYGMSEIGIASVELRRRPKERNRNFIGHPFDSYEYRLDEQGYLLVRGTSLCTKKLVNGEPVCCNDWFSTGDAMRCEDGHYYILGRKSETVIGENGENINPDMVEKCFNVDGVSVLSVLGLPGERGEELSLIAQVPTSVTETEVHAICDNIEAANKTLPHVTAVRCFYFTHDELVAPGAVKVSRAQIRKKIANGSIRLIPFSEMTVSDTTDEGYSSALYTEVCTIIASVLGVDIDRIQADSHVIFDLGATSLQYFALLSALSDAYALSDYDKTDTYRYTPKEICEYIERHL